MSQRVLIVDDEPPARERLRRLLIELGDIEVAAEAGNGEQAVRLAGELRPDVVLLDIGLPGMNGYEVARHLRGEPSLAGALLVALTGWGSEDDKRQSREAGFDFHLTKPVEVSVIEGILARGARGGA